MSVIRSSQTLLLTSLLSLGACADDPSGPATPAPQRIVVLNGSGQTGVTVGAAAAPRYLRFDPFDGATMTVERDSALSTSSAFSGDLVFVADLVAGSVQKIQIPSGSNAAGVVFVPSGTIGIPANTRFLTANRNTGRLGAVQIVGGATSVSTIPGAGLCPYDVLIASGVVYSVDANLECATTFASKGPVRLIRINASAVQTDTITLAAAAVGAPRAYASPRTASEALIFTAGLTDPLGNVTVPAAVSRVNLQTRQVEKTVSLPAERFGFGARVGENGILYVTAASGFSSATLQVYALDPTTLEFVGKRVPGGRNLWLTRANDAPATCAAATADRAGLVYCISNGLLTTTLVVFDAAGAEAQSVEMGGPAFDIALRDQVPRP